MSEAVPSTGLSPGLWRASWGGAVIRIGTDDCGQWHVRVEFSTLRRHAATRAITRNAAEAVAWACDVLRRLGALVFIDGARRPLEDVLAFVRQDDDDSTY